MVAGAEQKLTLTLSLSFLGKMLGVQVSQLDGGWG